MNRKYALKCFLSLVAGVIFVATLFTGPTAQAACGGNCPDGIPGGTYAYCRTVIKLRADYSWESITVTCFYNLNNPIDYCPNCAD